MGSKQSTSAAAAGGKRGYGSVDARREGKGENTDKRERSLSALLSRAVGFLTLYRLAAAPVSFMILFHTIRFNTKLANSHLQWYKYNVQTPFLAQYLNTP